ncbi:MAG: threonine/serine dehydratase [Pyrinomonadaceae bacterium]
MDIEDIKAAQSRIAPYVKRTPLEYSDSLSHRVGAPIYVKYEMFQKTGSFKARGAFNKLLSMKESERAKGVVAVSGGNHAQAVAYASKLLGLDAVILMPQSTPQVYVNATRGYGATIDLQPTIAKAFEKIKTYTDEGRVFLHPFDDPVIMAGQGTLGLEIMEDLPDVTDVIVSLGGGGLAGGVSTAVKAIRSETKVWGVETVGADAMTQALAAGHPVELTNTSIAKTLSAPHVSDATLALAQQNLESVTLVTDDEAIETLIFIAERLKVLTEPAASCTLAVAQKISANFTPESKVVLILCGGNSSFHDVCSYVDAG